MMLFLGYYNMDVYSDKSIFQDFVQIQQQILIIRQVGLYYGRCVGFVRVWVIEQSSAYNRKQSEQIKQEMQMQEENNHVPRRRSELTYNSWREQKRLSQGKQYKRFNQQQYSELLSVLEDNYSQARLQATDVEDNGFIETVKQLREIHQGHYIEMQDLLEDLNKERYHNQQMVTRLGEYETANTELKTILDRVDLENKSLKTSIEQQKESLTKMTAMLSLQNQEKARIENKVKQSILITESQEFENKSMTRVIKNLSTEIQRLKEQIRTLYFSESKMKEKHSDLRTEAQSLRNDSELLQNEIERLNSELDEKKYLLSKCISVNQYDETDSMYSYFKIVEAEGNQDDADDLQCLRNVEEGYQIDRMTARKSFKEIPQIEDFDKFTIRDDEFDRKSTGKSHARRQSGGYVEPMSDRRMAKHETPQRDPYTNHMSKIVKRHRHNPSGLPVGTRNSYPANPTTGTNFGISDLLSNNNKKLDTKARSEINVKNIKKNVTLQYPAKNADRPEQIQNRKLKEEIQLRNKEVETLITELKKVKKEVVNKCEVITKLEGENEMQITELMERIEFEKRSFHANSKTIMKLKGNIEFLKNLVSSLVNKIYISEQYYTQVISIKCQEFLQSQCSFIETRRAQIRSAISRLLKFYKDWIAGKDISDCSESDQNYKRRKELQDIIEKLNGCDIQCIRRTRFKSSRRVKKLQEDQIYSSKNSGSFYENMLNQMQMSWDEQQQSKSSLKKSSSMRDSINESLQGSIRDKITRFSIAHEVTVEVQNESPSSLESDSLMQNIYNSHGQVHLFDLTDCGVGDDQKAILDFQCAISQTENVLIIGDERKYIQEITFLERQRNCDRLALCQEVTVEEIRSQIETIEIEIQTVQTPFKDSQNQTKWGQIYQNSQTEFDQRSIFCQTEDKEKAEYQCQTKFIGQSFSIQTDIIEKMNSEQQTFLHLEDIQIQTEPKGKDSESQTNQIEKKQLSFQTELEMEAETQTFSAETVNQNFQVKDQLKDSQVQTLFIEKIDNESQVKEKPINCDIQTVEIPVVDRQVGPNEKQIDDESQTNAVETEEIAMGTKDKQINIDIQTLAIETVDKDCGTKEEDINTYVQTAKIQRKEIEIGTQKPDCASVYIQSEEVQESSSAQTDIREMATIQLQTDLEESDQHSQTQPKQKQQTALQTEMNEANLETQTAIPEKTENISQTEITQKAEETAQTQFAETNSSSQTALKQTFEEIAQTDLKERISTPIQTQLSQCNASSQFEKKEKTAIKLQTDGYERESESQIETKQTKSVDLQTDFFETNTGAQMQVVLKTSFELQTQPAECTAESQVQSKVKEQKYLQTNSYEVEVACQVCSQQEGTVEVNDIEIQVDNRCENSSQTEDEYQVYEYKEKNHQEVQTNVRGEFHPNPNFVKPQLLEKNEAIAKDISKKGDSDTSGQAHETPLKEEMFNNPEHNDSSLTPQRLHRFDIRVSGVGQITPSTNEKSSNSKTKVITGSKEPKQRSKESMHHHKGLIMLPQLGQFSLHYQLTQEDVYKLSPERIFQRLIPRPENSIYLQKSLQGIDKQFKWDKEKLYMMQIIDQSEQNPQSRRLLMWKKGLACLEDRTQLRVKPKGVMYDDAEMFTLGNSEVIARGNHVWVRKKNARCSSVYGNVVDGNWIILVLWVYSIK